MSATPNKPMLQAGLLKEYVARPAKCACLQGKGGTAGKEGLSDHGSRHGFLSAG